MDFEQLEASAGIGGSFGIPEMLSTAEAHGYYAWQHNCAWEDLVAVPFPALAELREGRFLVLGAFAQDRVLLQDPARSRTPRCSAATSSSRVGAGGWFS